MIVGVLAFHIRNGCVFVDQVTVHSDFRRQRVGNDLFAMLCNRKVQLLVKCSNEVGIKFYEDLGLRRMHRSQAVYEPNDDEYVFGGIIRAQSRKNASIAKWDDLSESDRQSVFDLVETSETLQVIDPYMFYILKRSD
jgi:ribosomal protein S18 acetylase RimI-like enzyme